MAEPTPVDYQESVFDDALAAETTGTVTWQAGDLIVVLGATADNGSVTLGTPTVAGLTFAAVASTPTNTGSTCKLYAWTATAGSSSSGAITSNVGGGGVGSGISVFAFRNSTGVGNTSIAAGLGSTTTQSLIRAGDDSHVVQIWGDWGAGNDITVTWTPGGQTEHEANELAGQYTAFVASWGNQGIAGTTSYGFSNGNATAMSAITLEIKGTPTARIRIASLWPILVDC